MAKYLILYKSAVKASDRMKQSTPEEMEAGMKAWMDWKDHLPSSVKFDFGMPLQATSHIDAKGAGECDNQVSGYSFIEGGKDEILGLLQKHPHLKDDGAIDLLEVLSMPGIDA